MYILTKICLDKTFLLYIDTQSILGGRSYLILSYSNILYFSGIDLSTEKPDRTKEMGSPSKFGSCRDTSAIEVKFIYSEKATKFYEISTVDLSYVVPVKYKVEISQKFLAFSEYMNCIVLNLVSAAVNFSVKFYY